MYGVFGCYSITGTPYFPLLVKITLPALTNHLLIFFAGRILTHISKAELAEMAKKMRAAAIMLKDSLTQKQKAPATTTQALTEQDEDVACFQKKEEGNRCPHRALSLG